MASLGSSSRARSRSASNYRILGWFENGFRQTSNKLRTIRTPADLTGMRIRVLPSEVQARTFELLGAVPLRWDLTEAIAAIKAGTIDAQENPFANTVTYGVHKFHRYHSVTNHFYISRPIFLHRDTFDAWPKDLQEAMREAVAASVTYQRKLAEEEDVASRKAIVDEGCEIADLTAQELSAFSKAVQPLWADAQKMYGEGDVRDGAGVIRHHLRSARMPRPKDGGHRSALHSAMVRDASLRGARA